MSGGNSESSSHQAGISCDAVGEDRRGRRLVDNGPETGGGGVQSLGMKRPLVVKPVERGGGRTLVGLSDREAVMRSIDNSPAVPSSASSGLGTD